MLRPSRRLRRHRHQGNPRPVRIRLSLIVLAVAVGLVALAGASFHLARSQMVVIGIVLWLPMYLAAIGLSSAYIHARTLNAVWNHLRIGPIRFSSSLRVP